MARQNYTEDDLKRMLRMRINIHEDIVTSVFSQPQPDFGEHLEHMAWMLHDPENIPIEVEKPFDRRTPQQRLNDFCDKLGLSSEYRYGKGEYVFRFEPEGFDKLSKELEQVKKHRDHLQRQLCDIESMCGTIDPDELKGKMRKAHHCEANEVVTPDVEAGGGR